eukprot:5928642-Alexandrium_andersonii.AAC.1
MASRRSPHARRSPWPNSSSPRPPRKWLLAPGQFRAAGLGRHVERFDALTGLFGRVTAAVAERGGVSVQ